MEYYDRATDTDKEPLEVGRHFEDAAISLTGCSEQRPSVAEVTVQLNQTRANIVPGIADTPVISFLSSSLASSSKC